MKHFILASHWFECRNVGMQIERHAEVYLTVGAAEMLNADVYLHGRVQRLTSN